MQGGATAVEILMLSVIFIVPERFTSVQ